MAKKLAETGSAKTVETMLSRNLPTLVEMCSNVCHNGTLGPVFSDVNFHSSVTNVLIPFSASTLLVG